MISVQITLGDIPRFTQDLFEQNITNSSYALTAVKENGCDKYGLNSKFSTQLPHRQLMTLLFKTLPSLSVMCLPHFAQNANTTIAVLSGMVRIKTAKHDSC